METVQLNNPYKIIPSKHKRYNAHYDIPASVCIVVPTKSYGDQIVSHVMWRGDAGEVRHKSDLIFDIHNLELISPTKDFILYASWEAIREASDPAEAKP